MRRVCSLAASASRMFHQHNLSAVLTEILPRWLVFGCAVTCFRVRDNTLSFAKSLIPHNYNQALWFYRRTRLWTFTSAGSSGSPELARGANEEDPPAKAVAFDTRLPIGKAGHSPVDGNAMAFPAFPVVGLESGERLEPGRALQPGDGLEPGKGLSPTVGTPAGTELSAGAIAAGGGGGGPRERCATGGMRRRRLAGGGPHGGTGCVFGLELAVDGGPVLSSEDVDGAGVGGPSRATSSLTAASATRRFKPQPGQQNLHTGTEWSIRGFGRAGEGDARFPSQSMISSKVCAACALGMRLMCVVTVPAEIANM